MKNVILIKTAKDCFDKDDNLTSTSYFKFLILKGIDKNLKILLMKYDKEDPYKYHAEGLLDFMKENKIMDIKVNGGGIMCFAKAKIVSFWDPSGDFGFACKAEILAFLKKVFPDFQINETYSANYESQRRRMNKDGKIYTQIEVQNLVNHYLIKNNKKKSV